MMKLLSNYYYFYSYYSYYNFFLILAFNKFITKIFINI